MSLASFFKKVGHALKSALGLVEKLVPEEQLLAAIRFAEIAGEKFVENAERREWVVAKLIATFHVPDSVARLITELAVQQIKRGIEKGEAKLEEEVKKD